MSENINFVPAIALPVAEGEEVSVLCLENGAMKQKPANGLGGGEKADMVIALDTRVIYDSPASDNTTVSIASGSLEAVVNALREGRPPVVKCERYHVTDGFDTSWPFLEAGVYDCDVTYYGGYVTFSFCVPHAYMMRIVMSIDDPEYLQVWAHPLSMTTYQVI